MKHLCIAIFFSFATATVANAQTDVPHKKHLSIYRTREEARAHCPDDQIVWASTATRTLYLPGNLHYRHTHGGYVCESAARASGYRGPTAHG